MNCKEKVVIDALLEQLSTAYNWKVSFFNVFLAFSSLWPCAIEVLYFRECQLNCDFVNSSGIGRRFPCSLEFSVIHVRESVDTGL